MEPKLTNDHWVSRGYQQNFADGRKRVAVLDVDLRRIIDADRPIKSNFREEGFTTFIDREGNIDDRLERAFASVERSVLNQIRTIIGPPLTASQGCGRREPVRRAPRAQPVVHGLPWSNRSGLRRERPH